MYFKYILLLKIDLHATPLLTENKLNYAPKARAVKTKLLQKNRVGLQFKYDELITFICHQFLLQLIPQQ